MFYFYFVNHGIVTSFILVTWLPYDSGKIYDLNLESGRWMVSIKNLLKHVPLTYCLTTGYIIIWKEVLMYSKNLNSQTTVK